jgi:excisionase family DNA binding protein
MKPASYRNADEKLPRQEWNRPLTTGQIAFAVGCAPRTVTKWIDSGRLKGFRLPGSQDRRVNRADVYRFLIDNGLPVPRELMCGARVVYGLSLPTPFEGWDVCDAFQLGELCHEKPVLAAVLGDEWGVLAAVKAAEHIRRNNPDAAVVFVVDAANAAAALPGEVRVRGEVDLGELMGAL